MYSSVICMHFGTNSETTYDKERCKGQGYNNVQWELKDTLEKIHTHLFFVERYPLLGDFIVLYS